jgi:hypothetical protein
MEGSVTETPKILNIFKTLCNILTNDNITHVTLVDWYNRIYTVSNCGIPYLHRGASTGIMIIFLNNSEPHIGLDIFESSSSGDDNDKPIVYITDAKTTRVYKRYLDTLQISACTDMRNEESVHIVIQLHATEDVEPEKDVPRLSSPTGKQYTDYEPKIEGATQKFSF